LTQSFKCKKVFPFPEYNFQLITQKAKEEIISMLKEKDLELASEYIILSDKICN